MAKPAIRSACLFLACSLLAASSSCVKGLGLFSGSCFFSTENILETKTMSGASGDEEHETKSFFRLLVASGRPENFFTDDEVISFSTLSWLSWSGDGTCATTMLRTALCSGQVWHTVAGIHNMSMFAFSQRVNFPTSHRFCPQKAKIIFFTSKESKVALEVARPG